MQYVPPRGSLDPNASYIGGNPSSSIRGSYVPAGAIEMPMREVCNAIFLSGLTPDAGDLTQLWQAMQRAAQGAVSVAGTEGVTTSSASVGVHTTYTAAWNIPGLTQNDTLADADSWGYFNAVDTHHRKTTWANIKAKILTGLPSTPYSQYPGIGGGVGQQIIAFAACPNDNPPASFGYNAGSTTISASTLNAGIYTPGGFYQQEINNNRIPVSDLINGGYTANPWNWYPGVAGTYILDAYVQAPGWNAPFGIPYFMIWRRIA